MALILKHPSQQTKSSKKKEDLGIEDSSFLMAASYNQDDATLTITMKGGSQYTYSSVDPSTFERFKQSRNKGKFYSDEIRGVEKGSRTVDHTVGPSAKKKTKN